MNINRLFESNNQTIWKYMWNKIIYKCDKLFPIKSLANEVKYLTICIS